MGEQKIVVSSENTPNILSGENLPSVYYMICRAKGPGTDRLVRVGVRSGLVPLHDCLMSRGGAKEKYICMLLLWTGIVMTRDLRVQIYEPDQVCCYLWLQPQLFQF